MVYYLGLDTKGKPAINPKTERLFAGASPSASQRPRRF
jgi:hypothetical protein